MMDENLVESKITSEDVFDGVLLHVKRDTVKLPNGHEAVREWIKHPGAASVIPLLPDGRIIMVRQYRYPVGQVTLEVPAGKFDREGEDGKACAERELAEETGYRAKKIEKLTTIATTVGFSNEYIQLFVATGLTPGQQHPDEDEFINTVKVPLKEAVKMTKDGRIIDAKTIISVLMLWQLKENLDV